MLSVCQIKLPVTHTREDLEKKLLSVLRIPREELLFWRIARQSLDARKKPDLFFVYTLEASVKKESKVLKKIRSKNVSLLAAKKFNYLCVQKDSFYRPVIVGSGPAGLFCAYYLVKAGLKPLLLERGEDADSRKKTVEHFWKTGELNQESNVQFGEGGAGTFSDGKLNTLVKDPAGRNREVLKIFVEAGATEEILYQQKPHLGTDTLINIVKNIRSFIEQAGGEIRFSSKMTDLKIKDGRISSITINDTEEVSTDTLVLAVGHSARDTFALMKDRGIYMEAKAFAVGVRVEHPQEMINASQYGISHSSILGAANYKLTHQLSNGRGVYSFCMCPGGYVVNASSEEGHLAINGMSYHARDSKNANSAMIVTVSPQDYKTYGLQYLENQQNPDAWEIANGPLAGIYFQRYLEQAAWRLHQGAIPVQTFEDFCRNQASVQLGEVEPCMKGVYALGNLREIFPEFIAESLQEGIWACGNKIQGFNRPDALLSGVESRTSSPVRIPRNEEFQCNIQGIYPCGEGAGYAGGITSAAMDGLRVAEAICKNYVNFR